MGLVTDVFWVCPGCGSREKAQLCNTQGIEMETMSQFASEKDLWKARCLRFAAALVDIMDGIPDHDIQAETGLPQDDCDNIAKARADARDLVPNAQVTSRPTKGTDD